jgi:hypothetical protein
MLELFVVTTYKWSMNLFSNPNPVYSHTHTRGSIKYDILSLTNSTLLTADTIL